MHVEPQLEVGAQGDSKECSSGVRDAHLSQHGSRLLEISGLVEIQKLYVHMCVYACSMTEGGPSAHSPPGTRHRGRGRQSSGGGQAPGGRERCRGRSRATGTGRHASGHGRGSWASATGRGRGDGRGPHAYAPAPHPARHGQAYACTRNGAAPAHADVKRPRHAQRAAFDEFLKFKHPGIDTAAAAMKFLAALKDQISFKGLKDVVWRLAKAAVASEQHGSSLTGAAGAAGPSRGTVMQDQSGSRPSAADVMEDKAPGLKRVEEFLRCAASNEASGVNQMVLPLLEALLGITDGSAEGTASTAGGGLLDRALSDLLLQVRMRTRP